MNKRILVPISISLLFVLAAILLAACGATSPSATPPPTSPSGVTSDGQALMQQRCTVCHSSDRITSAHKTADQWKTTVDRMISHGAQLTSAEEQTLIDYLAQNYK